MQKNGRWHKGSILNLPKVKQIKSSDASSFRFSWHATSFTAEINAVLFSLTWTEVGLLLMVLWNIKWQDWGMFLLFCPPHAGQLEPGFHYCDRRSQPLATHTTISDSFCIFWSLELTMVVPWMCGKWAATVTIGVMNKAAPAGQRNQSKFKPHFHMWLHTDTCSGLKLKLKENDTAS